MFASLEIELLDLLDQLKVSDPAAAAALVSYAAAFIDSGTDPIEVQCWLIETLRTALHRV